MKEKIRQYFDKRSSSFTYLIYDDKEAVLIDPVWEHKEEYVSDIEELGLKLKWVIDTHLHADHVTCSEWLRENTKCEILSPDFYIDGSVWNRLEIIRTPGHTKESKCVVLNNNTVFTGDTLLIRKCGRTDFQGGSAEELFESIKKLYSELSDNTVVYPGHDYSGKTQSTIGEEKRFNIRCNESTSLEDFIETMENLVLSPPKDLEKNVEHNKTAGKFYDPTIGVFHEPMSLYGVIAVDIDDTVISSDGWPNYENPRVLPGAIEALEKIHEAGYQVDFFTARHTKFYDLTKKQLDDLCFKYRRLVTSKPLYDYFVDDRAIGFEGDWSVALKKILEVKK